MRAVRADSLLARAVCLCLLVAAVAGQQTALSVEYQYPCKAATDYFDISSLQCKSCDKASRGTQQGEALRGRRLPAGMLEPKMHSQPAVLPRRQHHAHAPADGWLLPRRRRPRLRAD